MSDAGAVSKSATGKNSGQPQHLGRWLRHDVTNLKHRSMACRLDYRKILAREQTLFTLSKAKQTPASARNAHS